MLALARAGKVALWRGLWCCVALECARAGGGLKCRGGCWVMMVCVRVAARRAG